MQIRIEELLNILKEPDRIRIKKENQIVFMGYMHKIPSELKSKTVKRFRAVPEIRHKEWKKRGLTPPMEPEEVAKYNFSDLQMKLYYDIYI